VPSILFLFVVDDDEVVDVAFGPDSVAAVVVLLLMFVFVVSLFEAGSYSSSLVMACMAAVGAAGVLAVAFVLASSLFWTVSCWTLIAT
jgi:hypothetical protein